MSWAKKDEPKYRLVWALAVISLASCALWFGTGTQTTSAKVKGKTAADSVAPAATFPGAGTGNIPDGPGAGQTPGANLDITFAVTGITGNPSAVSLDMTATHSWVGDVSAQLIGPGGSPTFVLYRWTGSTTGTSFGDSSDLGGTYNFTDAAAGTNWWTAATAAGASVPLPPGDYRTTAAGGAGQTNPAPVTNLSAAFAGVANPNGTWTLRMNDGGNGDTGAVTAANLTITGAVAPSGPRWLDRDGDGKTDYVVARATASPLSEGAAATSPAGSYRERLQKPMLDVDSLGGGPVPIYWYTNNSGSGSNSVDGFGIGATDFITPNDYDGDGKSDIAIWRTGAAGTAAFYIYNSSDNTVTTSIFGQTNDDSGVTGDYDGDGKADVAVYRCPGAAGQCTFYYRGSAGMGGITYVPWGFGTLSTVFAAPGDYDGDGKHDFCIQRTHPTLAGKGEFVLRRSSDAGVEWIQFGNNTDIIAPGDYDGDGKSDFTVGRNESGQRVWYTLFRAGGSVQVPFGLSSDFLVPGDYDGDGKTDRAVWRPNADPTMNFFYHLNSSNFSVGIFEYGQSGDYPPANSQVH